MKLPPSLTSPGCGHKIGEIHIEVPQHSVLKPFDIPTYPSISCLYVWPMTNTCTAQVFQLIGSLLTWLMGVYIGICLEPAYGAFPPSASFAMMVSLQPFPGHLEVALWYCNSDINILLSA